MKRQRLPLYLTMASVLIAFAIFGYGFFLSQQSRALILAREPSPAVERYTKLQEVLAPPAEDSPASERPTKTLPQDMVSIKGRLAKETDPETREMLEGIARAEEVFSRFEEALGKETGRDDRVSDILNRSASSWSAEDWAVIRKFLAENSALLDEARALAAGSGPVYLLDFSEGFAMLLPHLAPMREMARLLRASAAVRAAAGDVDGASADFLAGLQVGARLEDEPLVISQLVRTAIDSIMYHGVVDSFPPGQIPPGLAAEIARYIHSRDTVDLLAQAIQTEGDMGLQTISGFMSGSWQQSRQQLDGLFEFGEFPGGTWGVTLYASPFARPWHNLDMMAFDHFAGEFETTLTMPFYEARPRLEQLEEDIAALPPTRVFTQGILPSMLNIHRAIARDQTLQQLFLLGVAVESYENEIGHYPSTLDTVQGLAGGTSIIDPHTGAPFRYNVEDGSFQLYSVGPNLSDDGAEHDFNDGDIVWRGRTAEERGKALVAKQD